MDRWNATELKTAIASGTPLLVDLRADWCPQCGPQEQVLDRLAPEFQGQVLMASLDIGEHPEVADNYGVLGLPALLLFQGGELREILSGFKRAPLVRLALSRLAGATDSG
jgi:thioredoxin-like negative regulator of GroEL